MDDIDKAVDELTKRGVSFERYEGFEQDDKSIARPEGEQQGPADRVVQGPRRVLLPLLLHDRPVTLTFATLETHRSLAPDTETTSSFTSQSPASCLVAVIPTLGLTTVMGAGLGNLFMYAPLPFRISILGAGIWVAVVILGAVLATDAAASRASRLTVREALAYL